MGSGPLLFDALPGLARSVPWVSLAALPTPVEPCDAIASWLGRGGVFMKRDDLASPLYGGNKVRRYEYVLADAREKGARRLVTAGGIASTQVMATALFGRELGFEVEAILFDQPLTEFAREAVLVDVDAGAKLTFGGGYVRTAWKTFAAMRSSEGAYLILPGAANPLANLGYLDAVLELQKQVERNEMPRPDVVVLPTGSSGTLAALALGFSFIGWPTLVIGVRITALVACNRVTVGHVIRSTRRWVRAREPSFSVPSPRFELHHGEIGGGYGHPTPAAIEGAEMLAKLTGKRGEVTYTGKALAGLRTIAREPRWKDKTILLWNTLSTARPLPSPDARARVPRDLQWMFERTPIA
jgi:D-cysteine desulfhydrase